MPTRPPLRVKIATEPWEFEHIYRLNHRVFAEEIPQHAADPSGRLVDRFHDENTYVIALAEHQVAGMIAVRGRRPFSLDERLPDLDAYLPPDRSICELRLLAVDRRHRSGRLLPAMLEFVWQHCLRQGYDVAIISAILRQLHLYRHLGFEPFGPQVGTPPVLFQPMLLTSERFLPRSAGLFRGANGRTTAAPVAGHFLPGPVAIADEVQDALRQPAISHRSDAFLAELRATRAALGRLTGASRVAILVGNGTTANDIVAGQLSALGTRGIVLATGEFGDRLADHARRWRLACDVQAQPWGEAVNLDALERHLRLTPECGWVWCVHCETSTGVLSDLPSIVRLSASRGVRVAVDAISSLGTMPVDLTGVYLASGVSGKGLASFPGLALVFSDHDVHPSPSRLPRMLDLGMYLADDAVPFTHSSNLLHALHTAITGVGWHGRFAALAETASWLRARLVELGFHVVGSTATPAPGIVTIALPVSLDSELVARALERRGYVVSAFSPYLRERNWLQIGLMGVVSRAQVAAVVTALDEICVDR